MNPVTDPAILQQLEAAPSSRPVTDPAILDELNSPITTKLKRAGGFLSDYYDYLHQPTEPPQVIPAPKGTPEPSPMEIANMDVPSSDFMGRVLPESVSKTAVGLAEFPFKAGHDVGTAIQQKLIEQGKPAEAVSAISSKLGDMITGVLDKTLASTGLMGKERLKEEWSTDPAGSALFAAAPVAGAVGKGGTLVKRGIERAAERKMVAAREKIAAPKWDLAPGEGRGPWEGAAPAPVVEPPRPAEAAAPPVEAPPPVRAEVPPPPPAAPIEAPAAPEAKVTRQRERPTRSAYLESQVPDLQTLEGDLKSVRDNLSEMETERAKGDVGKTQFDQMALSDRIKAFRESEKALVARGQELATGVKAPEAPAEIARPLREKTAEEISFEKAREDRGAAPAAPEPGTPEFYKSEAAKLPGDVKYIGDMAGHPMFESGDYAKGGVGNFMAKPGESVDQAFTRAKSKFEAAAAPTETPAPIELPKKKSRPPFKGKKEQSLQQRILEAGGIKIDPAMRGEFAQYGLRQGEGALARLYRSERHPGYKKAMGWDQWVEALIEDGTLQPDAGISDLFEAIKKNKRPGSYSEDAIAAAGEEYLAKEAARQPVTDAEILKQLEAPTEAPQLVPANRVDGEVYKAPPGTTTHAGVDMPDEAWNKVGTGAKIETGWYDYKTDKFMTANEGKALLEDRSFKLAEAPVPEGAPRGEYQPPTAADQAIFPGMEQARKQYREPGVKAPPEPPPEGGLFGKTPPSAGKDTSAEWKKIGLDVPKGEIPIPDAKTGLLGNESGKLDVSALLPAIDMGRNIKEGAQSLLMPSSLSPEHKAVAEILGAKIGTMHRALESSARLLKEDSRMFDKAGVFNEKIPLKENMGVKFMSDMSAGRKMSPELQRIADKIRGQFEERIRNLAAAGAPLAKVRENYFPGMWKDKTAAERFLSRRPFKGGESFRKAKVFDDIMEGIDAGLEPISPNPIDLVMLKFAEIDRSIMANQALKEFRGTGREKFLSVFRKMPEGWEKVNDKYGTVYGPPEILMREYVDKAVYDGLLKVADNLGVTHERKMNAGRGKLGWASPGGQTVTQFATDTQVLAHEIGHQLDFKYKLWDRIVTQAEGIGAKGTVTKTASAQQRGLIQRELRALADMSFEGETPSDYYKQKVRKKAEKMAHMLEAYIHAPEMFREVAPNVYDSFDAFVRSKPSAAGTLPFAKPLPEIAGLADIKPRMALKELQNKMPVGGFPVVGHRIVTHATADVLNNYLSSSLYNNRYVGTAFKAWMGAANTLNQSQLGVFSMFHGGFTEFEVQISAGANVLQDAYGLARGNRTVGDLGRSIAHVPQAMIRTPINGAKILNEWQRPTMDVPTNVSLGSLPQTPAARVSMIAKAAELAGGGFEMERGLRTHQADALVRDWYGGKKLKAALRSPIALTELGAKPIMEWLVPRQKAGIFGEMVGRIIEQNPGKSLEELRPQLRKTWNDVDARLGQVRYDRLFINNVAKNALQGLVRAPGWTGGTIAQIGGAIPDTARFFKEWAKTGKAPQNLPPRVAYTVSLAVTTAAINGILTFAFTGQRPQGMDFWAFRDGSTDESGRPGRFLLPTYAKDVYAWYKKPGHTALAKTHPALSVVGDLIRNTDYYGTVIVNPDDPFPQRQGERAKYVVKSFVPFWMRGAEKVMAREGGAAEALKKAPGKVAAPLVGIMPATAAYTRTPAENVMSDIIRSHAQVGGRTKEAAEYSQLRFSALKHLRSGKTWEDMSGPMKEKLLKLSDAKLQRIAKEAQSSPLQASFGRLTADESLKVWKMMNDKERSEVEDVYNKKIENHAKDMTDEEHADFKKQVDRAEAR
jgi:hypothetical protein